MNPQRLKPLHVPIALMVTLALCLVAFAIVGLPTPAATAASPGAALPAFGVRIIGKGVCPTDDTSPSPWLAETTTGRRTPLTLFVSAATQWPAGPCADLIAGETVLIAEGVVSTEAPLPGTTLAVAAGVVRRYPTPTPPPIGRIDVRGILRDPLVPGPDGSQFWTFDTTVSGLLTVTVTFGEGGTEIKPEGIIPSAGLLARVVAESRNGGPFVATRVEFIQDEVSFTGLVQAFPDKGAPDYLGRWTVGGTDFVVSSKGIVAGTPKLYRRATVKAQKQGEGVLIALQVTLDDTDGAAEAFTLQGKVTGLRLEGGPRVACIPFTLAPGAVIDDSMDGDMVQIDGYRSLGVSGALTATRIARFRGKPLASDIALSSYVDARIESVPVQLQLGPVRVDAAADLANLSQATQGTVVRAQGTCPSPSEPRLQAVQLDIIAKPYVRFKGTIIAIEAGMLVSQPQLLVIKLQDSADTLRVRPPNAWKPRYDPQVGYCVDGFGYLLVDGTVGARSLAVDRCPTPVITPQPIAPTATPARPKQPSALPGDQTSH